MTDLDVEIRDNPALHAWSVDAADFPPGGALSDALAFCLRYAILAPSTHNTQPWWFAVEDDAVVIGLDPSRGLAVLDPDDREATISVGAAIFVLRTALAHFGFATETAYWPDPRDFEACARVTVTDRGRPVPEPDPLFDAITRRHTSRSRFLDEEVAPAVLDSMVEDAAAEGATLHLLTDYPTRRALAELVSRADRQQMDDKRFRRELATWMRSVHTRRGDGIRAPALPLAEILSVAAPLIVRTFDVGEGRAATDVELATGSPVLAVLTTAEDDRTSWLRVGQALARVALRATSVNVLMGFLDQPVEVPELREGVTALLGTDGVPQLIVRMGYGTPAAPQPRRPLGEAFARR